MTCLSKDQLIDYLFGEDRSACAAAKAHISACAGCRARIESLKRIKTAAASVPLSAVSADFTARLMRGLPAEPPQSGKYLRVLYEFLPRPAWALGLAAFAVAFYFSVSALKGPRVPEGNTAEVLYFSDGPATVSRGFAAPSGTSAAKADAYSYTDSCATARCGTL